MDDQSITDQSTFILEPALSPIGGVLPDGVDVLNRDVVSGPQIKPEGSPPQRPCGSRGSPPPSRAARRTSACAVRWGSGPAHCAEQVAKPA